MLPEAYERHRESLAEKEKIQASLTDKNDINEGLYKISMTYSNMGRAFEMMNMLAEARARSVGASGGVSERVW